MNVTLDELEEALKKVVTYGSSEKCKEFQKRNPVLYHALTGAGNLAEVSLRLIAEHTRHDQW